MDTSPASTADEAAGLRRCLNDLVSVIALPALWTGSDPPRIVGTTLDALVRILDPVFVLARFSNPPGSTPIEMARIAEDWEETIHTSDVGRALDATLGEAWSDCPPDARVSIGTTPLWIALARPGLQAGIILVVGSDRADFPGQTERLALDVAANQAELGLQQARVLGEQGRVAAQLNEHVAQRTSELVAANEALQKEVTERRRAEKALIENERESRLIVDSMPGLVALLDASGGVELVNPQILEYTGRTLEELRQWGSNDIVHPEDLPGVIDVFSRSIASGQPYEIVQRLRRGDGVYRWFQNSGHPIRNPRGEVVRWCVLLTDIDERKRAEDALHASERNLTLIIDTIPALAWSARPDGSAEFFNTHYLDFIGLSEEEASGWGWTGALHPDDVKSLATTWQRILASEAPWEAEARIRRHDGAYRWFLFRANPLRDASGAIIRWYGVNTDIEDRKQAENELRRSEAFLTQAQRLTLTGSLWWNVATGEITWSDESYRLMGYPRTITPTVELIMARVYPDDLPLVREVIERSAREGANIDLEHRLLMPDGSIKYVHVVLQNVGNEATASEFVGAVVDITHRKQAEAELRRAYDSFRDAERLSHTGSFTADIVADEHVWSEELYRICEFDPGTKITTNWAREIIHPDDQPLFDAGFARSLQGADFDLTFRIITRSGTLKHLHSIARVVDRAGARPQFVGAIQDVTEAKNAEEALNRARSELAHVTRVTTLSTLTASIAHEVNQPLTGIITNAGTCLRMLDADPANLGGAREATRRIIRDAHRALEVMTRLRALFSKREFALESLNLNEAIHEVVALSRGECQRHRIMLQMDLADDLPLVTGDRVQLQQVILNLLRNAVDAMLDVHDRPRHLLIRTERNDEERVHVAVRDAGIGIDGHVINSLFEPFYTTKSDGMGIGLSISRSIVERHRGRIWAEPNDGPGATFRVSIPCSAGRSAIETA